MLKYALYCLAFIIVFPLLELRAQNLSNKQFEPVSIDIHFPLIADTTLMGLILQEKAWLPVEEFFTFLKIKLQKTQGDSIFTGFLFHADSLYQINAYTRKIQYGNKHYLMNAAELLIYENKWYLQSNLYFAIFGIECRFDYRSLQVIIQSKNQLPIVLVQKQRMLRLNLNKLRNEVVIDTIIQSKNHVLNIGVADWTINSVINVKGRPELQGNLAFGGSVLGGEMNAAFQYNNKSQFDNRQQYYLWRHVNNDHRYIKQIGLGKINTNAIASLFAPVVGIRISNTPTIQKQDFGTYRIERYTNPNWTVELYINNLLVNYTLADAAGFYRFDIPVLYGNAHIMLKQYGPNGEQKMNEFNINIPYNFLPKSKLEYIVNAGIVEDSLTSRFVKAQLNYGITNQLTIGTGIEYLSSISTKREMPFLQVNLKLTNQLLMTTHYVQDVKYTVAGNFKAPKNILIDAMFTSYKEGQKAIFNNYLEERNVTFSIPWKLKRKYYYSRINIYQIVLPSTRYTNIEAMVSGRVLGTGFNISNFALITEGNQPYLYANFSFSYSLKNGFLFLPLFQYEYNTGKFISSRIQLDKLVSKKTFLNFFFDHNYKSNIKSYNVGIRYDLPFLQAGYHFRTNSSANSALISYLRGSILKDRHSNYTGFFSRPGMGRSGIIVCAFLDYNNNGTREANEPKVPGLKFSIPGGSKDWNKTDTSFVIRNLEPYYKYLLTIDKNSFDEIAWRIHQSVLQIHLTPNQFTPIGIPVHVLGEVSGMITVVKAGVKEALPRIMLEILNEQGVIVTSVLSDEYGFYSYLGLLPGKYRIRPNAVQLKKLGYQLGTTMPSFTIIATTQGDSKTGIDLELH